MEEEVRFIESSAQRSDRGNDDVAVVSSTTNCPGGAGSNTVKVTFPQKKDTVSVETLIEYKTKYHADVVEWCPISAYNDHLVYGTYEIIENVQQWKGNIELLCFKEDSTSNSGYSVDSIEVLDITGVFDLKWSPAKNYRPTFAAATVDGMIQLFSVTCDDNGRMQKIENMSSVFFVEKVLRKPLSIAWDNYKSENATDNIVSSDSGGYLNLLRVQSCLEPDRNWLAHDFEAWTASFDCDVPTTIYSGADDCWFKGWDLRTNLEAPLFKIRSHTMGVTCVSKSRENSNLLVTGSYDEHIKLWDVRDMKVPLSSLHIEGSGVWRLKWKPSPSDQLLAGALLTGSCVVKVNKDHTMELEVFYNKHESMAYGIDWRHLSTGNISHKNIIASCSFEDNKLHVWSCDIKDL